MKTRTLRPIHPGRHLQEFIEEMEISEYRLAKDTGMDRRRVNLLIQGARNVTVDTALRLGRYFGQSPEFWLNLQRQYDLDSARGLRQKIERAIRPLAAAA